MLGALQVGGAAQVNKAVNVESAGEKKNTQMDSWPLRSAQRLHHRLHKYTNRLHKPKLKFRKISLLMSTRETVRL